MGEPTTPPHDLLDVLPGDRHVVGPPGVSLHELDQFRFVLRTDEKLAILEPGVEIEVAGEGLDEADLRYIEESVGRSAVYNLVTLAHRCEPTARLADERE
jgi:hypothetical protein